MSEELQRAVRARVGAYSPSATPPFDGVVARKRVRDRRRAGAAAAGAALTVAVIATLTSALSVDSRSGRTLTTAASVEPSSTAAAGSIVGVLPLCYGPGPNMNLRPRTTVVITGDSGWTSRRTFPSREDERDFHFDNVPPGRYVVVIQGVPDSGRHVEVQPGQAARVPPVNLGCL